MTVLIALLAATTRSSHIIVLGVRDHVRVSSILTPEFIKKKLPTEKFDPRGFLSMLNSLTMDDFKAVAESCNRMGEQVKAAGRKFAYHNHNFEFKPLESNRGYDILLKETSSELVAFELDCGWAGAACESVPELLRENPNRFRLLHVKNFKKSDKRTYLPSEPPVFTLLGEGAIDYKEVFFAAKTTAVEHLFVEHEPPYDAVPAMEVIKAGYEYLHELN